VKPHVNNHTAAVVQYFTTGLVAGGLGTAAAAAAAAAEEEEEVASRTTCGHRFNLYFYCLKGVLGAIQPLRTAAASIPQQQQQPVLPAAWDGVVCLQQQQQSGQLLVALSAALGSLQAAAATAAAHMTNWSQQQAENKSQLQRSHQLVTQAAATCAAVEAQQQPGGCTSGQQRRMRAQQLKQLRVTHSKLQQEYQQLLPTVLPAPAPVLSSLADALDIVAGRLAAVIPSSLCCNNLSCSNMASVSESFALVRGKGCVCGGCTSGVAVRGAQAARCVTHGMSQGVACCLTAVS
jgi:hypothetical protein